MSQLGYCMFYFSTVCPSLALMIPGTRRAQVHEHDSLADGNSDNMEDYEQFDDFSGIKALSIIQLKIINITEIRFSVH